ncbi:hypothetical protein BaRGS_00037607 [Batillaria attramentaria]|uniref:Uncharacterized protein n=1 Tax=Batillaria attramentaria TaxID=370345 RepID=A0ABD0J987_9CAEN
MGNNGSSQGQVFSKDAARPSQPQEPPYPGPPAQYHFVDTQVLISTQMTFSFTQSPMVTSNIDSYYPVLAAQYAQGFRLLSFYRIPGQVQQQGFFNPSVAAGFQGIFCRYPGVPPRENWQLRIEKSVIQAQRMFTGIITFQQGMVSDTTHILDSIARNTQDGGRLICIEMTGQQARQSMGMAMHGVTPVMGVDVFFEVPNTPMPEKYVYNVVSVPITVTYSMGFRPVPIVQCDWLGVLAHHLNQGWRLIEIFMDMTTHTQMQGFSSAQTLSAQWYFEKPASRVNDPTPVYQGTMVEHLIKVKAGMTGTRTAANWEPVIQDMGNRGWELACILETPETHMAGLASITMKCLLFFQRPLMPQSAGAMAGPTPPSYDSAVGGAPHGGPPPAGFNVPPPPEKMGY